MRVLNWKMLFLYLRVLTKRNRKTNTPVAGVVCQSNAAVIPGGFPSMAAIGAARECSSVRSAL